MVRIKERYLLVNILYPPSSDPTTSKSNVPDFVVRHQPTIERLTPQALLKAIKAEIALLYGDFGSGAIEGNLSGRPSHASLRIIMNQVLTPFNSVV